MKQEYSKHHWTITKRGRKTKYYNCLNCGALGVATSLKQINSRYPRCIEEC